MAQRDLTAGMLAEIAAVRLRPVIFFEGEFVSSGSPTAAFLRLWTGISQITWNGVVWTGAGNLLAFSPIEERSSIEAIGFSVTLSGMPSETVALALQSTRQGKPGKLWLGCMNDAGALVDTPYLLQHGKFDVVVIDDDGEHCTITASYESRLVDLLRPRTRRYTTEDQKLDYPDDLGFEYVPQLQDKQLIWGGPGGSSGGVPGGGGGGGGNDPYDNNPPSSGD